MPEQPDDGARGLVIGRIAGIPIAVEWPSLILSVLIATSVAWYVLEPADPSRPGVVIAGVAILLTVAFYLSLLAHELGHAVVARRHGLAVQGISLWLLGGVSRIEGEAPTPEVERSMALIGPAISLALGIVILAAALGCGLAGAPALLGASLGWLGATNFLLGLFNLIPAYPLDGGRVLRASLWRRGHDRLAATRRAARTGGLIGRVLIALGIVEALFLSTISGLWLAIIGWFLDSAARIEERSALEETLLADVHVGDVMTPDPERVPDWITVEALIHDHILTGHHTAFPIRDFDNHVDGMVTLEEVRALPAEMRQGTRVRDIATPLTGLVVAQPADLLRDLVTRMARARARRALVIDGDRLVGMVTTTDIALALQRAELRAGEPPRAA